MFCLQVARVFIVFSTSFIVANGQSFTEIDDSECVVNKSQNVDVSQIQVHFYDPILKVHGFVDTAAERIAPFLDIKRIKRLVVFVPGYRSFTGGDTERWAMEAFLKHSNTSLIIIDYSYYTREPINKKNYLEAVKNSYSIGKAIGEFLSKLQKYGYPSSNIHCFGHSFGGQLLSFISEVYTENTREKLWRVTGIDPSGTCFEGSSIDNQIRSGIGDYVEVYHCSKYGTSNEVGDIDVMFNQGNDNQPDCEGGKLFSEVGFVDATVCSHVMCAAFWLNSVDCKNCYKAFDSYKGYLKGGDGQTVVGYQSSGDAFGVFYASTNI
ncbi:hypothetical protein O3G_MSEX010736 [Manduca sexta]|uniref:Esterase n=1 Tax=Manduca sexta TaxID=7130 RepID=A0A922CSU0_MANSE|nr:hypothetical protein O3G_MSEX010736 [Manduca sexta]UXP71909.1 esterase [Manduca sexta]